MILQLWTGFGFIIQFRVCRLWKTRHIFYCKSNYLISKYTDFNSQNLSNLLFLATLLILSPLKLPYQGDSFDFATNFFPSKIGFPRLNLQKKSPLLKGDFCQQKHQGNQASLAESLEKKNLILSPQNFKVFNLSSQSVYTRWRKKHLKCNYCNQLGESSWTNFWVEDENCWNHHRHQPNGAEGVGDDAMLSHPKRGRNMGPRQRLPSSCMFKDSIWHMCQGHRLAILRKVIYNAYNINPYYWVDDHRLSYGNNGSLDPSTYVMLEPTINITLR